MAITRRPPNKVHLSGDITKVNDLVAGEGGLFPGMLVEVKSDGGVAKVYKQSSATNVAGVMVLLDQPFLNQGMGGEILIGELVLYGIFPRGGVFWGLLASGQNIQMAEALQSAGDGYLKSATASTADAGVYICQSQDEIGAITEDTYVRAEVIR